MEPPPIGLIFFIALLFFMAPGFGPSRPALDDVLHEEIRLLDTLRNSTFGVPGNLTGLETVGHNDTIIPPASVRKQWEEMRRAALGDHYYELALKGQKEREEEYTKNDTDADKPNLNSRDRMDGLDVYDGYKPTVLPIWHNITTTGLHGKWEKHKDLLPIVPINGTLDKNVTINEGRLSFNIDNVGPSAQIQELRATLFIKDEHDSLQFTIPMQGYQFTSDGNIVMTSSSEKFAGMFGLPHFALTKGDYLASKEMVVGLIQKAIDKQRITGIPSGAWAPNFEQTSLPHCDYIAYLQLHPLKPQPSHSGWRIPFTQIRLFPRPNEPEQGNPYTASMIAKMERELRHRTGVPLPPIPPITVSSLIYSPTCGHILTTPDAHGLKVESHFRKLASFALTTCLLVGFQIWLLIRQLNEANTPSTMSRISFWTVAMLALLDGYLSFAFLFVGIAIESTFLPVVSAGFFALVGSSFFGIKFLYTIHQIQQPTNNSGTTTTTTPAPPPAPAQTTPPPAPRPAAPAAPSRSNIFTSIFSHAFPTTGPNTTTGLPLPVTTRRPSTPIILAPDQDAPDTEPTNTRTDASAILSRFVFYLFASTILLIHITTWPYPLRTYLLRAYILGIHSFWVPQIVRNVMRGCRKALTWEFVSGVSGSRLVIAWYAYYLYAVSYQTEVEWDMVWMLAGWVWIQIWILVTQNIFGPRFLLPPSWLPESYDYHPLLPPADLEAGSPDGSGELESNEPGVRIFDCAICKEVVRVPTVKEGGRKGVGGGWLGRREYMVTPCRHVFHTECLEGWMRYRLCCPVDRNGLPPL